jgi:hypothetical protein
MAISSKKYIHNNYMNIFSSIGSLTSYKNPVFVFTPNPTSDPSVDLTESVASFGSSGLDIYNRVIYATNYATTGVIKKVDLSASRVVPFINPLNNANPVYSLVLNGYIYSTGAYKTGNVCAKYDLNTGAAVNVGFIKSTNTGYAGYCIDFDETYLFIAVYSNTVGKYSIADGTGTDTFISANLNRPFGIAVNGNYIYISNNGNNTVTRYFRKTGVFDKTLISPAGSPGSIRIVGKYIYLMSLGSGSVNLYDINGGTSLRTILGGTGIATGFEFYSNYIYFPMGGTSRRRLLHTPYEFNRIFNFNNPQGVFSDGNYYWVTNYDTNTVVRTQISNQTYKHTINVGTNPNFVTQANNMWWVANNGTNNISIITDISNVPSNSYTVTVDNKPNWLSADPSNNYVWVAHSDVSNNIYRVSVTDRTTTLYTLSASIYGIASDAKYLWCSVPYNNAINVYTISTLSTSSTNNPFKTITVGTSPTAISYDSIYMWVANSGSNTVSRITVSTLINATPTKLDVTVGNNPNQVVSDFFHVFVTCSNSNIVYQIRASTVTDTLLNTISIQNSLAPLGTTTCNNLYPDGYYVWVTNTDNSISQIVM